MYSDLISTKAQAQFKKEKKKYCGANAFMVISRAKINQAALNVHACAITAMYCHGHFSPKAAKELNSSRKYTNTKCAWTRDSYS